MGIAERGVFLIVLCCLLQHMISAVTEGFNCTFDIDACGWAQDDNDKLDWIRNKGNTFSPGTGPNADHTTGYGYYMYIDSPWTFLPQTKAHLISPVINGTARMCLVFYYHMYGFQINTLNVFFSRNGTLGSPVWTRHKTQGNVWKRGTVQIDGGSETASVTNLLTTVNLLQQIVFEAKEGEFIVADIAIDDVSLEPGTCPEVPHRTIRQISSLNNGVGRIEVYYNGSWGTVCYNGFTDKAAVVACRQLGLLKTWSIPTIVDVKSGTGNIMLDDIHCNGNEATLAECDHRPWGTHSCSHSQDVGVDCDSEGFNCTFDTNACAWFQSPINPFHWTKSTSDKPGNGPKSDHTSGNGSYMYIDTSDTQTRYARIFSPPIIGSTKTCFMFHYNMFGGNVGDLKVYFNQIAPRFKDVLTVTQSQGNVWKKGQVQIPGGLYTMRIMFEGVQGPSYQGVIAIDDVRLTPGACDTEQHGSVDASPWIITAAIVSGCVALFVFIVICAVVNKRYRSRCLQSGITVVQQRMRDDDGMENPVCDQEREEAGYDETVHVQSNQSVTWSRHM